MAISITFKSLDRSFETDLKKVYTVPKNYLKLPEQSSDPEEIKKRYPHLSDVALVNMDELTILIGAGNQWVHLQYPPKVWKHRGVLARLTGRLTG